MIEVSEETKTGKVENIEFTRGGFGNQWTTIDGVRYATWWDYRELAMRVGVMVEFVSIPDFVSDFGQSKVFCRPCVRVLRIKEAI